VVADGIYEWPEPFGISDTAGASKQLQAAGKCLLLHVLYRLPGSQSGAQFQVNQLAEIRDEVVFRGPVARTEPLGISAVKRLEVHVFPSVTEVKWCKCTPAIASFLWLRSPHIETNEARPSLLCNVH
jgi:hypothetical protein